MNENLKSSTHPHPSETLDADGRCLWCRTLAERDAERQRADAAERELARYTSGEAVSKKAGDLIMAAVGEMNAETIRGIDKLDEAARAAIAAAQTSLTAAMQRADRAEAECGALRAALDYASAVARGIGEHAFGLVSEQFPDEPAFRSPGFTTQMTEYTRTIGEAIASAIDKRAALASGTGARAQCVIEAARTWMEDDSVDGSNPMHRKLIAAVDALDREQPEVGENDANG